MTTPHQEFCWRPDDTARLAAAFRSIESERETPLVRDGWARCLAGHRGHQLLRLFPGGIDSATGSIVRTLMIDELILSHVRTQPIDTVLCVGAGYDTRPYRLALPQQLDWIELDLPETIERKNEILKDAVPSCNVQRIAADLFDESIKSPWVSEFAKRPRHVLALTEGLLVYLTLPAVISLAAKIRETCDKIAWITDLASPLIKDWMNAQVSLDSRLRGINWTFAPKHPSNVLRRLGWKVELSDSCITRAANLNRPLMSKDTVKAVLANGQDPSTIARVAVLKPIPTSSEIG